MIVVGERPLDLAATGHGVRLEERLKVQEEKAWRVGYRLCRD